jgi:cytoskeletal protein CcmA (bactofilin family)
MLNRPTQNGFAPDPGRLASPATLLSITGQMAKMHGRFEIADSLHVECEMGGELVVGGQLVIGERGEVNADVQTVDAIIQGSYAGNLIASGTVEITATGRVTGNIETDSLVISKGGFFNGNVVRTRSQASPSASAAPVVEEQRMTAAL